MVCQNASHFIVQFAPAGQQRQMRSAQVENREPHRQPNPGRSVFSRPGVNLIESPTVGEVGLLPFASPQRLIDGEELHWAKVPAFRAIF